MAGKNQSPYKTEKYWFLNNQWKENFLKPFLPKNTLERISSVSYDICQEVTSSYVVHWQ